MERTNRWLWRLVIAVTVFFMVVKALAIWAEGIWFASEGYGDVFLRRLSWQLAMFVMGFTLFFALVYLPYRFARKAAEKVPMPLREKLFGDMDKLMVDVALDRWALGVCIFLAVIAGLIASSRWVYLMHFLYATPFGRTDPIFNHDVGFYVFTLPFLRFWVTFVLVSLMFGLIGMVLRLRYEELLRFEETGMEAPVFAARPLLAVVACFLFLLALAQFLGRYSILFSGRGALFGAGFADVYGTRFAFWLLMVVSLAGAGWCLYEMGKGELKRLRWVFIALFATWLIGRLIFPAAMQAFVVKPNERERERPFLAHNIAFTRYAYNLDKVRISHHPGEPMPSINDLKFHETALSNIRLWDIDQLLDAYSQLQSLHMQYGFSAVDYDRYYIGGRLRQVAIAPRELFLPKVIDTWLNRHLHYTHGYGVVMSLVTEFTGEGSPLFVVKDIPPKVNGEVPFRIRRPEIYFGEFVLPEERKRRQPFVRSRQQQTTQTTTATPTPPGQRDASPSNQPPVPPAEDQQQPSQQASQYTVAEFVLVRTRAPEFDYPLRGERSAWKETRYEADAGVKIGSWWRRLLFAARFMDLGLLLNTDITSESRLLMYRRVLERVSAVAPFLLFDRDPYPIITSDGRVVWIIDAFTVTSSFPYSTPLSPQIRINYLRNSVKVTVDAYTGEMNFFAFDSEDPILKTYRKAFPRLFRNREEMPPDVKAHIRYPQSLFAVQASMLCLYHMTDPDQFYLKEDAWEIAQEQSSVDGKPAPVRPYYTVIRSPDDGKDRFMLLIPFAPFGKPDKNMVAWMAAHCDYDRYGDLFVYKFPSGRLVDGPQQIEAYINADAQISQYFSLWNRQGSRVIRGSLLILPIGSSLLYVEPIYLQAEQTPLPEIKRVIVSAGRRVVMGEDLWDALSKLFGTKIGDGTKSADAVKPSTPKSKSTSRDELFLELLSHMREARRAREDGDWLKFGVALNKMFEVGEKAEKLISQIKGK
ncbi:MAG: UPF0182 family protein [Armatimonadetes bacterium]|nr:UPF0182 family protein [Armatimonadota bacterium]MCX7967886.1 UPF0182 family protein [Armatimonadota bacterium]MDW8142161.1 UPF0182 family protein [Armatimonadota bacterium]